MTQSGTYGFDRCVLNIGRTLLSFTAEGLTKGLAFSPSHDDFLITDYAKASITSCDFERLDFLINDVPISRQTTWKEKIAGTEIWELWTNWEGNYVFHNPLQDSYRQVIVERDFSRGRVLGNFSFAPGTKVFPIPQDLEIVIFANWLGTFGDIILHASGISKNGKGYVFAGNSGVGKSTLAAQLANYDGVTILGEDQVILRRINNDFWVFGTPWHENPAMCSSLGVPLEKLYFLERGIGTSVEALPAIECVSRILQTAFIPYYQRSSLEKIVNNLETITRDYEIQVLCYLLGDDLLSLISN